MASKYTIPGVYVEEIPRFPPSVAQVETAIPAFIGYTEKRLDKNGNSMENATPTRVSSLKEFETHFGIAPRLEVTEIRLDADNNFLGADVKTSYYLYHALQLFYANGGGDCYVVSVGEDEGFPTEPDLKIDIEAGIKALELYDEPTIICFPDAAVAEDNDLYELQKIALEQSALLGDRITLCDLEMPGNEITLPYKNFRNNIGIKYLKYGAAYTPWLKAIFPKNVSYEQLKSDIIKKTGEDNRLTLKNLAPDAGTEDDSPRTIGNIIDDLDEKLNGEENADAEEVEGSPTIQELEDELIGAFGAYKAILNGLNRVAINVPPSGAVAGVMATVDRLRGVWKAPANVSINSILGPSHIYNQSQLGDLNIDVNAGKSINAIRSFTGKGTLVWGARTLAGNDNEWRYVNVRRFFNMVEESVKKATEHFVFEPNDANTWVRVQAMIENFLTLQWRQGALQGAKQEHAFRVAVGLGKTMTAEDILNGRMIVEIAMAPVRPAEFIILRFEQKMPES
jgi:phage tail sheath protein FI